MENTYYQPVTRRACCVQWLFQGATFTAIGGVNVGDPDPDLADTQHVHDTRFLFGTIQEQTLVSDAMHATHAQQNTDVK